MKSILIYLFVIFAITTFANGQTKESVYERIVSKYGNIESFSTNFTMSNAPDYGGSITAARGNKYQLALGSRIITCDSKIIWNYSARDNNVIISQYDELDANNVSIEQFFFEFLVKYKPVSLKNETSTRGIKTYILKLQPQKAQDIISGVDFVEVYINSKSMDIYSLGISTSGNFDIWNISNLKTNLNKPSFTFIIPENTQVIDLR